MVDTPMADGPLADETPADALPDEARSGHRAPIAAESAAIDARPLEGLARGEATGVATAAPDDGGAGDDELESAAAFRKPRPRIEAQMDMTPMVDVTFLLLIFFMVTAAFAVQKAKETAKQDPDDAQQTRTIQVLEDNPDYVTIHVDEYGVYRVVTVDWDREAFSPTELLRHLKDARRGSQSGHVPSHVLLKAHGDATHEKVIAAHDAANAVGIEDVQLLTVEESD
jgi:biopolymer transport protein ExbD